MSVETEGSDVYKIVYSQYTNYYIIAAREATQMARSIAAVRPRILGYRAPTCGLPVIPSTERSGAVGLETNANRRRWRPGDSYSRG